MKKIALLLYLLNITFNSAEELNRSSYNEFNYSSTSTVGDDKKVYRFKFRQRLFHDNKPNRDDRIWEQRYAVTLTYYKKGGPAFLFLRPANPMYEGNEFSMSMLEYVKNFNAICFAIEHRFYGETRPVNGSMKDHLHTNQLLADIAYFIQGMSDEFHLPKQINWILFGCSFGGVMAAWARRKYPHLIHGAVASSAPIITNVVYEYEQIVEESLKSYDSKCVESITAGFEETSRLTRNDVYIDYYEEMFCPGYLLSNDIIRIKRCIIHRMIEIFSAAVQANDFPNNNITIATVCRIMNEYNGTKFAAFPELLKMYRKYKESDVNIENEEIKKSTDEAWHFQRCSEYGDFSSLKNVTFLSTVKDALTTIEMDITFLCEQFFGPNVANMTERINRTNFENGGLDYNVSNVIFINGSLDPWYKASLYKKSNGSLYEVIFIKGTSHCADTDLPSDRDPPELKQAHKKKFNILQSWLQGNLNASVGSSN